VKREARRSIGRRRGRQRKCSCGCREAGDLDHSHRDGNVGVGVSGVNRALYTGSFVLHPLEDIQVAEGSHGSGGREPGTELLSLTRGPVDSVEREMEMVSTGVVPSTAGGCPVKRARAG